MSEEVRKRVTENTRKLSGNPRHIKEYRERVGAWKIAAPKDGVSEIIIQVPKGVKLSRIQDLNNQTYRIVFVPSR